MPLVSVVIPTHNRPELLDEAIASVRAQTFADYEIIVVSNGESAETRRASQHVAIGYNAAYLQLDRANVSSARNAGVASAKGEWIAFLDDDDLWIPAKLERQIAEAKRTGADMITCGFARFSPDGRKVADRRRLPQGWSHVKGLSHQRWWMPPSTALVRKRLFDEVGNFDPTQQYGEDTDLWRRMSWHHTVHQIDEVLVLRRQGHPSLAQHARSRALYDLRHFFKMRRDTPRHLRSALPRAAIFVPPRLVCLVAPTWLLRLCRRVVHRTQLRRLRHRLRPGTRVRGLIQRLRNRRSPFPRGSQESAMTWNATLGLEGDSRPPHAIGYTAAIAGTQRRFQIEGLGEAKPAEIVLESIECIREGLQICEEEIRLIDEAIACEKIPFPTRIPSEQLRFVIRATEISSGEVARCNRPEAASPPTSSAAGFDWFRFPAISRLISHYEALHQVAATIHDLATAGRIFIVGKGSEAVILKLMLRAKLVASGYGRGSRSSLAPPCIKRPARGSFVARLLAGDLTSRGVGAVVFVDDDAARDDLSLLAAAEVGIPAVVCGRSPKGALHVTEIYAKGLVVPLPQVPRPKISVVTVSFNQAAYLEDALTSVLDQGYPNLEYIVIDGGSTDGSVDIINRYRDRLSAVVIEPDRGQSDALNKGFAVATGDIMTWLCSDDMLEPRSLDRVADAYVRHGADVIAGGCIRIGETRDDELRRHHTALLAGATISLEPFDLLRFMRSWERGNYFYQPEVFFSRRIWEAAGGYVKRHLFYMMDYDLWLRMALAGASVHHIPFTIACSRVHASQKTRADRHWYHQARQIIEEYRDVFLHLRTAANSAVVSDSISRNPRRVQGEQRRVGISTDSRPSPPAGGLERPSLWQGLLQAATGRQSPQANQLLRLKLRGRIIVMLRAVGCSPSENRLLLRLRAARRSRDQWATLAAAKLRTLWRRVKRGPLALGPDRKP